jgi:addiction module HigA family antidote
MTKEKLSPIHPGEILKEEFLDPMNISEDKLAKDINISHKHINEIIHGERHIDENIAIRLGKFFGIPAQFWLNLQSRYDLEDQKYFWTAEWQKEERVADRNIKEGNLSKTFYNIEDFIEHLNGNNNK